MVQHLCLLNLAIIVRQLANALSSNSSLAAILLCIINHATIISIINLSIHILRQSNMSIGLRSQLLYLLHRDMFLSHSITGTSAVALVHAQVLVRPILLHLDAVSTTDDVDGIVNVRVLLHQEGVVGLSFPVVY